MPNKFRLRMYQLEMESMSDVASTKAGKMLNLTVSDYFFCLTHLVVV